MPHRFTGSSSGYRCGSGRRRRCRCRRPCSSTCCRNASCRGAFLASLDLGLGLGLRWHCRCQCHHLCTRRPPPFSPRPHRRCRCCCSWRLRPPLRLLRLRLRCSLPRRHIASALRGALALCMSCAAAALAQGGPRSFATPQPPAAADVALAPRCLSCLLTCGVRS